MKQVVCVGAVMLFSFITNAQSKQIKLYLEQIAANKVYIGYLQKGYRILRSGLTTIGNIKDGHFRLDRDFFAAMESINPKIKNYSKVVDIIAYNISIAREFKTTLQQARETDLFTGTELSYLERVFGNLLEGCNGVIDALTLFISPGRLKMSDDERIKEIDALHDEMQDRYIFCKQFCAETNVLAVQRKKELNDVNTLKNLHGIK